MSGAGSLVDLDQQIISNTTAEVTSLREQTTKARITEIYLFFIYGLFCFIVEETCASVFI